MQKIFLFLVLCAVTFSVSGQKLWQKQGYKIIYPDCYASDEVEKCFVPPPSQLQHLLKSGEKKSQIIVSYSLFPNEAKVAFEYAKSIWEGLIESPVPIYIQANWRTKGDNVLGSCGPSDYEKDFEGAPQKNIYYPIPLVEKIQGIELTGPDRPDMIAEFNKDVNWYFGTDGNTPTQMYDFVSVVLHEIGHGLGFTGFFFALDLTGGYSWFDWGDATSFDRMIVNTKNELLIDSALFANPSVELKNQLVSNALYSNSPVAKAFGNNTRPRLYSPSVWDEGSSIYHLNDATYPSGTVNTLMTHSYGRGEATHHPGPVTLGIMADIGWKNMRIEHIPLKDLEAVAPLNFEVQITSDYPVDLSRVYLVYSDDSFATTPDSIPLVLTGPNLYEALLPVNSGTTSINYYISAADTVNRIFRYPADAPKEFFTVKFGPDNILPSISHEPIPYLFDTGNAFVFAAKVEDNLGIDTVYVEYTLNGVAQEPFGLSADSGSVYKGVFPLSSAQLNDNDVVAYQIVAVDASSRRNTRKHPLRNSLSFKVEKMFEPVTSYTNPFEEISNDFILDEFNIYLDEGFDNGALHSPHPYPSPDEDNVELNFTTVLKYPVVLKENAMMSFDEVVLVEPGSDDTKFGDFEFWDFVIVEGSKDFGNTWLPVTDGYDSRKHQAWETAFNSSIAEMNSTTVGSADLYFNNQINMLANGNFTAGDTLLIRFRLFSDPYSHGWGWAIDNLQIQLPVNSPEVALSPGNVRVYPNPFTGMFKVVAEPMEFIDLLQFEVFNMHGQKISSVLHKNVNGPVTSEINIKNGSAGLYLLVVKENGRQVLSKKIIHN